MWGTVNGRGEGEAVRPRKAKSRLKVTGKLKRVKLGGY